MEGWNPFLHVDDNLLGLLDSLLVPCSKFEIGRVNPAMHSKSKSQPQQVFQVPFLFGGLLLCRSVVTTVALLTSQWNIISGTSEYRKQTKNTCEDYLSQLSNCFMTFLFGKLPRILPALLSINVHPHIDFTMSNRGWIYSEAPQFDVYMSYILMLNNVKECHRLLETAFKPRVWWKNNHRFWILSGPGSDTFTWIPKL